MAASGFFENVLRSPEHSFRRHAERLKPAADVNLGVSLATEMAGGGTIGCGQIPFDDGKLLIPALDHEPMDRIRTDNPANLALEFLQIRHALLRSAMAWPQVV
jgi:hypothetical protein